MMFGKLVKSVSFVAVLLAVAWFAYKIDDLGRDHFVVHQEPVVGAVTAPKMPTIDGGYTPLGPPIVLSSLNAVSRLSNIPPGAHIALIQCESQNVRWWDWAFGGTLSTRTDNDTGVVTCVATDGVAATAHTIATADTVDVWWSGGARYGMTATVSGAAVTVDGGAGDNLPVADTVVEIGTQPTASSGTILYAGGSLNYDADLEKLRFLEEAASATVTIQPYGP